MICFVKVVNTCLSYVSGHHKGATTVSKIYMAAYYMNDESVSRDYYHLIYNVFLSQQPAVVTV